MDQIIITIVFILSLFAGVATLVTPVWAILEAVIKYLKYIFSGPFKVQDQTKAKKTN